MPRPPETNEPIPEWSESEYLGENDFATLAARRVELKQQQDEIQAELEQLNLEIGAMLATADMKSVRFGTYRFTLAYSKKGGRLEKSKLLELGVSADVIERATTPKEVGNPYVSVTPIEPIEPED